MTTDGFMRGMVLSSVALVLLMPISYAYSAPRVPDEVTVGNLSITIRQLGLPSDVGQADMREWVARSARIVRGYLGEFSLRSASLEITTVAGAAMGGGRTFGYPRPRIEVSVGRDTSAASLEQDWVLVHEMIHLSLPAVPDEQNWFAEGVAVYAEGVARAQSGNLSNTALWEEYVHDMPKGLPLSGDQGLDNTHTWARTYWGGALYFLLADVRIRELTRNRRGLQDALRAIAHAGAGMTSPWSIQRFLTVGDAATGTKVMSELYETMKNRPIAPDLNTLWEDLGIQITGGLAHFNDSARLASIREAITRPPVDGAR